MNTRRDALKMMAAGLGFCVLPSIGLSKTRSRPAQGANIMGIDQLDGRLHYMIWTPTTGAQSQCDFEHLPGLMDRYKIDQCVIGRDPMSAKASRFAAQFPKRVTTCGWMNSKRTLEVYCQVRIEPSHEGSKDIYVPGKIFLNRPWYSSHKVAHTVFEAWNRGLRKNHRDDAIMYARVAQFIQTAT